MKLVNFLQMLCLIRCIRAKHPEPLQIITDEDRCHCQLSITAFLAVKDMWLHLCQYFFLHRFEKLFVGWRLKQIIEITQIRRRSDWCRFHLAILINKHRIQISEL